MPPIGSRLSPPAHILIRLGKVSAATMDELAKSLVVTIDGKAVATPTATSFVGQYNLLDLWIDSRRTVKLANAYKLGYGRPQVTYTVAGKPILHTSSRWWMPRAQVVSTVETTVSAVPHSTVREVYQREILTIKQPALSMRASWRRDGKGD